jgi:hypothetical protein
MSVSGWVSVKQKMGATYRSYKINYRKTTDFDVIIMAGLYSIRRHDDAAGADTPFSAPFLMLLLPKWRAANTSL